MTSIILLCAGLSRRFGSPKALAQINGITVIELVLRSLCASSASEIVVVLGAHSQAIKPAILEHTKVKVVYNKDHKFGQTSSFQKGLQQSSSDAKSYMLLPVDCPFVQTLTIDQMISAFQETLPPVLVPVCAGRKGHPPIFRSDLKSELLNLNVDQGINTILRAYDQQLIKWDVEDQGVITSFNTPEELEKCRPLWPPLPT